MGKKFNPATGMYEETNAYGMFDLGNQGISMGDNTMTPALGSLSSMAYKDNLSNLGMGMGATDPSSSLEMFKDTGLGSTGDSGTTWFGENGMANTAIQGVSALANTALGFSNLGLAKKQYGLEKQQYTYNKSNYDDALKRKANALANS